MDLVVRASTPADIPVLARLRHALWPEGPVSEHASELPGWLERDDTCSMVAVAADDVIGFAEGQLRSHADGCSTSPVGYLEGWYVAPAWRRQGAGAALVAAFERWALKMGCVEVASDTWPENVASLTAHERLGYVEVDRAVRFRKTLDPTSAGPHRIKDRGGTPAGGMR